MLTRFSISRQDNAQQLMRHLYQRPVVDVKAVVELLGVTSQTAGAFVRELVEFGVLVEITEQRRNRLYVFREYLALFSR